MTKKINWGIIGLGKIAHKFAQDLLLSENAILKAVASREINKAKEFGEKYQTTKHYGSYEAIAKDPEIDIIYIATPHVFHYEYTMMCLKNNKSVLCEKPMGMNTQQVKKLIAEAKNRNLFLMEGIWTRFIPATEKLLELLSQQAIGDIESVQADFGFKGDLSSESRVYNKSLGGGSLLDVGIYPIYLSLISLGTPNKITAHARMLENQVDGYCTMELNYDNGAKANLESSIDTDTPIEAIIKGTKGSIKLHRRFHHSEKITISKGDKTQTFELKYKGNGYFHEIEEVNECLLNGRIESKKLPLQNSQQLISILDGVRKEINLSYHTDSKY